jgi:hypothetical protein
MLTERAATRVLRLGSAEATSTTVWQDPVLACAKVVKDGQGASE